MFIGEKKVFTYNRITITIDSIIAKRVNVYIPRYMY